MDVSKAFLNSCLNLHYSLLHLHFISIPFQHSQASASMESKNDIEKAPEKSFEALVKYCEDIQ